MSNCFYSLSRFRSDLCDLLICTLVAYFIKLFWIWIFGFTNVILKLYKSELDIFHFIDEIQIYLNIAGVKSNW